MSRTDMVFIFTALGGTIAFIATVVRLALMLQKFISDQFKEHRKLMYKMLVQRDRAIRRLEFWAIKTGMEPLYQPGADPAEFNGIDAEGRSQEH